MMRAARVGHEVDAELPDDAPGRALGPRLRVTTGPSGPEVRSTAGALLSVGHTHWREGAVARRVDPTDHGITLHADLAMTAFYCPISGLQLAIDCHRADQAPSRRPRPHVRRQIRAHRPTIFGEENVTATRPTALVTGSASGIGKAAALRLARGGYDVVINDSRSAARAEETLGALRSHVVDSMADAADVSDDAAVRAMVAGVIERFGKLDVLVNNAGTTSETAADDLEGITTEDWDRVFAVNVRAWCRSLGQPRPISLEC